MSSSYKIDSINNNVQPSRSVPEHADEGSVCVVQSVAFQAPAFKRPRLTESVLHKALRVAPGHVQQFLSQSIEPVSRVCQHYQQEHNRMIWNAIEQNLPEFNSIIIFVKNSIFNTPSESLEVLMNWSKKQMTLEQYQGIRAKYNGPLCIEFFQEINATIRHNHDEATVVLGRSLHIPGIDERLPVEAQAQVVRAWFNDGANAAAIAAIKELNLSRTGLKVVPKELARCSNLESLNLSFNCLKTVNLSNLSKLCSLVITDNQLTFMDLSGKNKLVDLDLSRNALRRVLLPQNMLDLQTLYLGENQLEEVPALQNMPALLSFHLDHNQLTRANLPDNMPVLETLDLSDNNFSEEVAEQLRDSYAHLDEEFYI